MSQKTRRHRGARRDHPNVTAPAASRVAELRQRHLNLKLASELEPPREPGRGCRCGSHRTLEVVVDDRLGLARLECQDCGRSSENRPASWARDPIERARRHLITFGKYSGWTVGEIQADPRTRRYFVWLAKHQSPFPHIHAAIMAARLLSNHV